MDSIHLSSWLELRQKSYISYEWIISEACVRRIITLNDQEISSKFFNVPKQDNLKYGFRFGRDPTHLGKNSKKAILKFQLQNLNPKMKYDANMEVSIKSAKLSSHFITHFDYPRHRSFDIVFCKWDELFDRGMNYINENQELIIKCEGIIYGKERDYHGKDQLLPLEQCLEIYQKPAAGKTICVDVDEQKIFIDAEIYQDMFHHSYADYSNLNISDFSHATIERAVKFHYHPHLIYPLTFEELMEIGKFFDIYGSKHTLEDFAEFLLDQIDGFTVCYIIKWAINAKNKILEKECFKFLSECIKTNTPVAEFDELPKELTTKLLDASVTHHCFQM